MARGRIHQKPVKSIPGERLCKICGNPLSRYNKSDKCYHHGNHNEMEFTGIIPEQKKEKSIMVGKEKQKCEMCGNDKTVSSNNGKMVCSSCTVVQGAAKLRPAVVCQSLRDFHGSLVKFLSAPERAQVVHEHNTNSVEIARPEINQDDISALTMERDELNKAIADLRGIREDMVKRSNEDLDSLQSKKLLLEESVAALEDKLLKLNLSESLLAGLEEKIEYLNLELAKSAQYNAELLKKSSLGVDKAKLSLLLAEIGQGIVDGKKRMSGRIFRELRKLAA